MRCKKHITTTGIWRNSPINAASISQTPEKRAYDVKKIRASFTSGLEERELDLKKAKCEVVYLTGEGPIGSISGMNPYCHGRRI